MERQRFECVLDALGGTGRWQLTVFLWAAAAAVLVGFANLSGDFGSDTPQHRCVVPGENSTWTPVLELWIPRDGATGERSRCQRFHSVDAPHQLVQCDSWVYSGDGQVSQFVIRWDLVCDRAWLLSVARHSHTAGWFLGGVVSGFSSDYFGRSLTLYPFSLLFTISSVAAVFSNWLWTFVLIRFTAAVAGAGLLSCLQLLCFEIVGPRWRALTMLSLQACFSLGSLAAFGAINYSMKPLYLQLVVALPSAVMLVFWLCAPESPRWLAMHGRFSDALAVCQMAAGVNGYTAFNEDLTMTRLQACYSDAGFLLKSEGKPDRQPLLPRLVQTAKDNFKSRFVPVFKLSFALFFNWRLVGLIFCRVPYELPLLQGLSTAAAFLYPAIEISAFLFCAAALTAARRRTLLVSAFSLYAVFSCVQLATSADMLVPLLLSQKFFSSMMFALLALCTFEVVPTCGRALFFNWQALSCYINSNITPTTHKALSSLHVLSPGLLFGLLSLIGCGLLQMLPETDGSCLPDTLSDAVPVSPVVPDEIATVEQPNNPPPRNPSSSTDLTSYP